MASGFGRRFGGNKLLSQVEGSTLIRRAMDALPPHLFDRAVLVSQYASILDEGEAAGFLPLPNPQAQEGIAAGIRLGLTAVEDLDGALFAVCDQPWLSQQSVARLAAFFRAHPHRIAALSWAGRRGNPVVFPQALFPQLAALRGDTGGSAVLRAHVDRLSLIPASAARELEDVDFPRTM